MTEIRFTTSFRRRLKTLSKRYRQIRVDILPTIEDLKSGNFIGDQIKGLKTVIFQLEKAVGIV